MTIVLATPSLWVVSPDLQMSPPSLFLNCKLVMKFQSKLVVKYFEKLVQQILSTKESSFPLSVLLSTTEMTLKRSKLCGILWCDHTVASIEAA